MKNKLLLVIILFISLLIVGCTSKVETTNVKAKDTGITEEVLCSDNDIVVTDVDLVLVDSTYNFQVLFSNTSGEDREFDMTKFEIKLGDKTLKLGANDSRIIEGNKKYILWSFIMTDPGDLKVGDVVRVYYNNKFIKKLEVTQF